MAKNARNKDDMLMQATAYVQRIEWRIRRELMPRIPTSDSNAPCERDEMVSVFAGIRVNGAWSVYVGQDPVLQFSSQNQLRRLYYRGRKYVANAGKLMLLSQRTEKGRIQLQDVAVTSREVELILEDCKSLLACLAEVISDENEIEDAIPSEDKNVINRRMRAYLTCVLPGIELANDRSAAH